LEGFFKHLHNIIPSQFGPELANLVLSQYIHQHNIRQSIKYETHTNFLTYDLSAIERVHILSDRIYGIGRGVYQDIVRVLPRINSGESFGFSHSQVVLTHDMPTPCTIIDSLVPSSQHTDITMAAISHTPAFRSQLSNAMKHSGSPTVAIAVATALPSDNSIDSDNAHSTSAQSHATHHLTNKRSTTHQFLQSINVPSTKPLWTTEEKIMLRSLQRQPDYLHMFVDNDYTAITAMWNQHVLRNETARSYGETKYVLRNKSIMDITHGLNDFAQVYLIFNLLITLL
jgi:hypothetical protein